MGFHLSVPPVFDPPLESPLRQRSGSPQMKPTVGRRCDLR